MKHEQNKRHWFKITLYLLLAAFGLILLSIAGIVILYSKTDLVEKAVVDYLNHKLDGQGAIAYKSVSGSLLNHIIIEELDIQIENQVGLKSKYLEIHYDLIPLLSNKIKISQIFIDHLDINIPETRAETTAKSGDQDKSQKTFRLDSTLARLENTAVMDSLLKGLPDIAVSDIRIYAGSVKFERQPITLQNISIEIERLAMNDSDYLVKLNRLEGRWLEKDINLRQASCAFSGDRDHFTLNQLQVETDKSKLACSAFYGLKKTIELNFDIYELSLDLNEIYKATDIEILRNGKIQGTMSLSGQPVNFNTLIRLTGEWQNHLLRDLSVNLSYEEGLISVRKLNLDSDAGRVFVEGQGRERQGASGSIRFADINLMRISPGLPASSLTGFSLFDFESLKLFRSTGNGSLALAESQVDSVFIDSLQFALSVNDGNWKINSPSFLRLKNNKRFELEGTLDRNREVDLTFSTFDNDLHNLTGAFGLDNLFGLFDLQMRMIGNLDDPTLSGNLTLPFFATDSVRLDSITAQLHVQKIFSDRNGEFTFKIDSGMVYGVPVNGINIAATSLKNRINIEQIKLESKQNYLSAAAHIDYSADSIMIDLPFFKAEYEKYWLENSAPIVLRYDSTGIIINQLKLIGPENSQLELSGAYLNSIEDFRASLVLDRIELKPFEQFWRGQFTLLGTINGTAELTTPLHKPDLNLDLNIQNLVFDGVELGDLTSRWQFSDSILYISELSLSKDDLTFNAGGNFGFGLGKKGLESFDFIEGTQADFRINWDNISLSLFEPLFKLKKPIRGEVSGYLEVGGNIRRPVLRQYLALDDFEYGDYSIDSLRMFGQYNSGYLIVDSLSAIFNETQFDLRGWQKYDLNLADIDTNILEQPMNLLLRSKDDQISFVGLFNEQLESINGDYELELFVGGTPAKPAITQGYIRMPKGEILLSRVLDPIENVKIDLAIEDSILTVNQFSGNSVEKKDFWEKGWRLIKALIPWSGRKVNEGLVKATGTIDLAEVVRPKLDLEVKMKELYINYFIENTKLLITTESLKLAGRDTISIKGGIYIPKAEYEVDLTKMEKNVYLYATTVQPLTPPFLDVNLDIQIPGGFNITSSPLDLTNNFRIGIQGDLQVIMEPGSELTQITGHLDVPSGKYASWNQNFEVRSGSIDFINPKVLNPDINIVAAKMVGSRLFELIVTGNLENLSQQIRVTENGRELDLPYLDKIAMLTLGTDMQQLTSNADSTLRNVGSDVATTSLLTAVERGAEQLIGLDKVEISSNENILDLNKVKLNNGLRDASISFGKYLTTDLYIEYRTQFNEGVPAPRLSWDSGNRLGLQYRINRYWSFDSYYEKTNMGNNKVQVGLNWEYSF